MSGRRARRVLVVGMVAAMGVAVLPGQAWAGGPGVWTALSGYGTAQPNMSNIDQPTVLRVPGGDLQVVWNRETAAGAEYRTATVTSHGATRVADTSVLGAWTGGLITAPRLRMVGGQRFLLFGTAGATDPNGTPISNQGRFATSADGVSWAVSPLAVTTTNTFYAGYGQDVVDNGGQPLTVTNGAGFGTQVNLGAFPALPAPAPAATPFDAPGSGCCSYNSAVERDSATGVVWGAYYSNATSTTARGVQYAPVTPTVGVFRQVPGTSMTTPYDGTTGNGARIPLAARVGGGVYLATPIGYPSANGIRVMRLGSPWTTVIHGTPQQVSITAAPGGRIWVSWIDRSGSTPVVKATRSNPAGTRFGRVVSLRAPATTTTIWNVASDGGAAGLLDVVVTASTGNRGGAINVFHSQVQAPLTVSGRYVKVRGHRFVRVVVSDAGAAVSHAAVRYARHSYPTNARGVVNVPIAASVHRRVSLTVGRAGYARAALTVRVP